MTKPSELLKITLMDELHLLTNWFIVGGFLGPRLTKSNLLFLCDESFVCGTPLDFNYHASLKMLFLTFSHVSYVDPGLDLVQVTAGPFLRPHQPL